MWNSSARLEKNDGSDPNVTAPWLTKGNVTEQGIIKFFLHSYTGEEAIAKKKELDSKILETVSFTSKRKKASVVVRNKEKEGTDEEVRVYCKGAPDMLFPALNFIIGANGQKIPISSKMQVSNSLLLDEEQSNGAQDTGMGILERTVKKFAD